MRRQSFDLFVKAMRLTLEAASLSSFCFCSRVSIDIGTLLMVESGEVVVVTGKLFNRRHGIDSF
jgi:hypothetical protein